MNPQFDTLSEFFAMGGHALYVWLAYGSTIGVLLVNFFMLRGTRNRQLRELKWSATVAAEESETENE